MTNKLTNHNKYFNKNVLLAIILVYTMYFNVLSCIILNMRSMLFKEIFILLSKKDKNHSFPKKENIIEHCYKILM